MFKKQKKIDRGSNMYNAVLMHEGQSSVKPAAAYSERERRHVMIKYVGNKTRRRSERATKNTWVIPLKLLFYRYTEIAVSMTLEQRGGEQQDHTSGVDACGWLGWGWR
jgi:hypothetical protein